MISHADLVYAAHAWLLGSQRHDCAIAECGSAMIEIPDVIGWKNSFSTVVECKTSRADFRADLAKPFRSHPEFGMGYERWYFTPKGLLRAMELPVGWGLAELRGSRVFKMKDPVPFVDRNLKHEMELLVTALQRTQRGFGPRIFSPSPETPIYIGPGPEVALYDECAS